MLHRSMRYPLVGLLLASVVLIIGCTQPGGPSAGSGGGGGGGGGGSQPPVVTASIVSAGSSSSINSNFTIVWTCTNTGNVPIAISAGTLKIRGSTGGLIAFSQSSSTLVFGAYWNPGQQYSFTISGNSNPFIPWYYDASLTVTDGAGNFNSYSQSVVGFTIF